VDDLVVFDFVKLTLTVNTILLNSSISFITNLGFERFNSPGVECACCQAEICELDVAAAIN
jgi:hypothetical protein